MTTGLERFQNKGVLAFIKEDPLFPKLALRVARSGRKEGRREGYGEEHSDVEDGRQLDPI